MKERERNEKLSRISSVIRADQSAMSEGCKTLVLKDFAKLFGEYFEMATDPQMEIVYERGTYQVKIEFTADRIKKFNVLK